MKRYKPRQEKQPTKAIREHCIECMGGRDNNPSYTKLIAECPSTACAVYAFRFGENPYHKQNLSDEQRKKLSKRARNSQLIQRAACKNLTNLNDIDSVDI